MTKFVLAVAAVLVFWVLLKELFGSKPKKRRRGPARPKGERRGSPRYVPMSDPGDPTSVAAITVRGANREKGSLKEMLAAMNRPCHPVDRHYLLQTIVEEAYRRRKNDPAMRDLCERVAWQYVDEFPSLKGPLRREMGEVHIPVFERLATVLTERGEYERAIEVCETAMANKLHDGTQSGFEGRIARIKKKAGLE